MDRKPHLLLLSHVFPFPGVTGQQLRVSNTLKALRPHFHVTFTGLLGYGARPEDRAQLEESCDEVTLLPSRYLESKVSRVRHKLAGELFGWCTGLKFSNYLIGEVELDSSRLERQLEHDRYDLVLFEYWHAVRSVPVFRRRNIPCVLDMHNVLWQSYARQLSVSTQRPRWWRRWALSQYRRREERAWNQFDAVIAINAAELEYTRSRVAADIPVLYAPMGLDTELWPYCWSPSRPARLAYYGGLGSKHNQDDALHCHRQIMPEIWKTHPETELWIVGSNPPDSIRALAGDRRVHVTGFVERPQEVLKHVTAVLCPWTGTYGFRSRLIEVMALGVPVVASPDAAYGMGLQAQRGLFLESAPERMAQACRELIGNPQFAQQQSQWARQQVEEKFSFAATYGHLAEELAKLAKDHWAHPSPLPQGENSPKKFAH